LNTSDIGLLCKLNYFFNFQVMLVERSRVHAHSETEHAFHVLYRLLAGAEGSMRREMGLDHLNTLPNLLLIPLLKVFDMEFYIKTKRYLGG
jgi:myosin-18